MPVEDVHATPIPDINEDAIETIGWPAFAATVGRVWNELPQAERSTAVVYTSNYGEAGAIARYGRVHGIPRAYSGHNAFWRFGRPPDGARPIIVVGYHRPETLRGDFSGCVLSARVDNGVAARQRGAGRPDLDLRDDHRAMVEALAATALAQPVIAAFGRQISPIDRSGVICTDLTQRTSRTEAERGQALPRAVR